MESICDKVIRCLCSCLIKKGAVSYVDVNQQHHKFMAMNDGIQDNHQHSKNHQKQFNEQSTVSSISNKLSNFFEKQQVHQGTQKFEESKEIQDQERQPLDLINQTAKETYDYENVIGVDHPYSHLFIDKLRLLKSIFQIPADSCFAEPDTSYPLKMYCYQDGKSNVFKYFFKFPTDFETYQSISNNFQLQMKFDTNIDQFKKIFQTPDGDAKLIYLSYKKVLIMSSRDFQYVRYTFQKGKQYWNLCVSDLSREEVKGKVRGQMILTTTRIIETGGEIQVSVSSQTDMKLPIKLEIAKNRGFAQIRKYLDKVYSYIKNNESKSII